MPLYVFTSIVEGWKCNARNQRLFVSSTLLLWLTVFNLSNTAAVLLLYLSSTAIFMVTALLNLLTACLPHSRGLAAQDFLLSLIPILSTSLMQELTSIFILSSLLLVNSGTLYLILFSHLPTTWTLLKEEYQDTCTAKLSDLLLLPAFNE